MYISDTIAAIATAAGSGGIGIVRVSGPDACEILQKLFSARAGGGFDSHRLYYGYFVDPSDGSLIDEGMAVIMRSPRSYTREDVAEFHSHGGYTVLQKLLFAVVAAGARLADPGEFTRRAFLNGRIDLSQAESVIDIINSRTDSSLALAQRQREGALGREVEVLRSNLLDALALLEAHIDFPEDEIEPASYDLISANVSLARNRCIFLIETFKYGKVLREGVSVLFAGKPNVGKSSLLNSLSFEERAIVSATPGTTRDIIEETIVIDGLPIKLVDAAGIRRHHSSDIEFEGIRRTKGRLAEVDLVVFLVDGSTPFDEDDQEVLDAITERPFIVVVTKADLPSHESVPSVPAAYGHISISSKSGLNIDKLRNMIFAYFMRDISVLADDKMAISNIRHRDVLARALSSIQLFEDRFASGFPPELLSVDLREALSAIGEITGATTPDDVLDQIFSNFCIGK